MPQIFFTVENSLVGDNSESSLTEAPVGSPDANGNLIGGPIHGVIDPLLGDLADNGGPTLTHALLPGSPAINRGDLNAVAGAGDVPLFDQRGDGFDRVFSGRIDIGAFELQEFSDLNLLVDTLDDESDGDFSRFDLSLREAIELANANPAPDTIHFDPLLAGGTILLTMGELAITDSVEIIGLGAELLTIDASGNDPTPDENNGDGSRVFNINDGDGTMDSDVELRGLTLTGGDVSGSGGAIFSREALSVIDGTISDSFASSYGGGIRAAGGTTTITGSTISGNSAGGDGGGIRTLGTSPTTITDSTIVGNSADLRGGGIMTSSPTTITGSTITGNSASFGGGLSSLFGAAITIADSTFSGNSARGGGGIGLFNTTMMITDSAIWGNTADEGGGIWVVSSTMTINDSTISGNSAVESGGGIWASGDTTTIVGSTISNNSSGYQGGGIYSRSLLRVSESTISGNSASFRGGGILSDYTANITGSTISGNSAGNDGGGILVDFFRTTTIADSTISGNSAGNNGGGIWTNSVIGSATITNSTISGNSADNNGGGIYFLFGGGTVSHSTIVGNTSGGGAGGGVFIREDTLVLDHTIVAQNTDHSAVGPDITGFLGVVLDVHFSLIGTNRGTGLAAAPVGSPDANGNLIGDPTGGGIINPLLGPLADNGGPTLTHALLAGSPAIDAGVPGAVANANGIPEFDQRGFPFVRVFGARIDIGAFESQPLPGDFDGDGDADGDDLAQWEGDYGLNGNSDADGDGQTSGIDFLAWQITQGMASSASGQETMASESVITVASDSSTDTRLNPRLVDAALAVGLDETDRFSLGRRVAGRQDAVVVDEVFRSTDFFGPPVSPANRLVTRFSRHLLDSRQSTDMSRELSDELLESPLAAGSFALL